MLTLPWVPSFPHLLVCYSLGYIPPSSCELDVLDADLLVAEKLKSISKCLLALHIWIPFGDHPLKLELRRGLRKETAACTTDGRHVPSRTELCKLTWLVLGEDPAARSHRVEQFTAL